MKEYFINKYYLPDLHLNLTKKLFNFANTSIDVSDGLITDLQKLIFNQKLSFKIYLNSVPISQNLNRLIFNKNLKKLSYISRGDDYQVLFTASPSKSRIINKIGKSLGIKISKIGKICKHSFKSEIIGEKGNKIALKNKGYYHQF